MNTLRNTVSLIGNLGADPVITKFGNDRSVARFSVATNESYKDKKGEWVTNTTWHNVVAWDKAATLCEQLLKKGTELVLEGKLVNDAYETKEGEKRYKTEISMREFMLLNRDKNKASK
ncbi:single-stranded DNA-binding protein [Brumimicrobium salinarum]|uniref:Single-stranded DNA-binding protein n=1 Tax=Brumimicrobium salinarum TaxID=2058658 RepID=A0A2I0R6L4_9FLAO|nr:single-stranded DNA-binding protein [Brumimicrobium salinarum]PKR82226.1 single-stranded DNA-binding protein [Brumimicrobium salinarum]